MEDIAGTVRDTMGEGRTREPAAPSARLTPASRRPTRHSAARGGGARIAHRCRPQTAKHHKRNAARGGGATRRAVLLPYRPCRHLPVKRARQSEPFIYDDWPDYEALATTPAASGDGTTPMNEHTPAM